MTRDERGSPAESRALTTARLRLVAATPAMIDAELASPNALGSAFAATVPDDWPPEHHDLDLLPSETSRPGVIGFALRRAR